MSASAVLNGDTGWYIEHAEALDFLATIPDASVDSVVTDPPAGIAFMARAWDKNKGDRNKWIAWLTEIMREVYRVLKPGAHGLVWALPRTSHWTGMALEDAGFEIRDCFHHVFGSGFPKSVNMSKAIQSGTGRPEDIRRAAMGDAYKPSGRGRKNYDNGGASAMNGSTERIDFSELAAKHAGKGTGLKPAHEDWWLIRKPLEGTIVATVLKHGTGALNIDTCRVEHNSFEDLEAHKAQVEAIKNRGGSMENSWKNSSDLSGASDVNLAGRWPANLLLTHSSECVCSGEQQVKANATWDSPNRQCESTFTGKEVSPVRHGDGQTETVLVWECAADCPVRVMVEQATPPQTGRKKKPTPPASRYFQQFQSGEDDLWPPFLYVPKSSRKERDAGLEYFRRTSGGEATGREDGAPGTKSPRAGAGRNGGSANVHPTVKSVALMRYLQRLVTPPGGVTLDIFVGSGTSGVAAIREGFRFIGCDMNDTDEEPFVSIARARCTHAEGKTYIPRESLRAVVDQGVLF